MKRTTKPNSGRAACGVAKVSQLKAGLSSYLARVERGEEVLVTDRGRPVARLVPVDRSPRAGAAGAAAEWARVGDLERRGVLRVGAGGWPPGFWAWERVSVPEGWLERWLGWERGEGSR